MSRPVNRPWGWYMVLYEAQDYKIKEICVSPSKRLSLQKHKHRSEHWFFLEGRGTVKIEEAERTAYPEHCVFIRVGARHRIECTSDKSLRFLEIQTGESFDEYDIIREEDDFRRADDQEDADTTKGQGGLPNGRCHHRDGAHDVPEADRPGSAALHDRQAASATQGVRRLSDDLSETLPPQQVLLMLLNDLLEWEQRMELGGFEAPVWSRARKVRDQLERWAHGGDGAEEASLWPPFMNPKSLYHLSKAPSSSCPDCNSTDLRMLATTGVDDAPAFWLCKCGFVGQIGAGRVKLFNEEEA